LPTAASWVALRSKKEQIKKLQMAAIVEFEGATKIWV